MSVLLPILMIAALSILTLPIYFIDRKYREEEEPEVKRGMNLGGMITFSAAWIAIFLFGIPMLVEHLYYQ